MIKKTKRINHGFSNTRLYGIWHHVLVRGGFHKGCNKIEKKYVERGITVCLEWHSFLVFKEWAEQNGYRDDLQIDRINNDLGYYPENCHFVTAKENMRNTRRAIRLPNGKSFQTFLDELKITERKQRMKYISFYKRNKTLHPELKMIMQETMD